MSLKASRLLQIPTLSTQIGCAGRMELLDLRMDCPNHSVLVRLHQIAFHSRPSILQRILGTGICPEKEGQEALLESWECGDWTKAQSEQMDHGLVASLGPVVPDRSQQTR